MASTESRRVFEKFQNQLRRSLVAKNIKFVEKTNETEASFMISWGFLVPRRIDKIDFDAVRVYLRQADYQCSNTFRINGELYCEEILCPYSEFERNTVDGIIRKVIELRSAEYASFCRIL